MRLKDGAQRTPLSARYASAGTSRFGSKRQFTGTTPQVLLLPSADFGIVVLVNRAVG
jgi:hypothetical protein